MTGAQRVNKFTSAKTVLAAKTDEEHLAHALLLWRAFYNATVNSGTVPTNLSMEAADKVLILARRLGVTKEFMAALTGTPVLRVKVKKGLMTVEELEDD